jgi:mono/diheme cytochrome c family protein
MSSRCTFRTSRLAGLLQPFAVSLAVAACGGGHVPLPDLAASSVGDTAGLAARGEYLVRNVSVCGHCHADPRQGADGPLVGGRAFRDWRLGTIGAANLTPDRATGLGAWSEAEIVRAIQSGEDREGHLLAPIMPYEWLSGMSDRDALAMAVYLRGLPAVENRVERHPNLMFGLAKTFFLHPARHAAVPAPQRAPTAEYGHYLADAVALCADCHTPRGGIRSAPVRRRLYAGSASPPRGFPANPSNLTPDDQTGIGRWTEDEFLRTLRTGVNPRGDTLHPFMPWRQYRRMTDDDLRAIYRYLRTLPPIHNAVPRRPRPAE